MKKDTPTHLPEIDADLVDRDTYIYLGPTIPKFNLTGHTIYQGKDALPSFADNDLLNQDEDLMDCLEYFFIKTKNLAQEQRNLQNKETLISKKKQNLINKLNEYNIYFVDGLFI